MGDFGLMLYQMNTVQHNCKNVFVKVQGFFILCCCVLSRAAAGEAHRLPLHRRHRVLRL